MKEFLQSIFKSTEDRIKNPFVGAFITSWIVFNWKPILYLIFAADKIKDKIDFIITTETYNNIWNYLYFPLISAVFYVGMLPFVSLLFEFVVNFAIKWRNKVNLDGRNNDLKLQIAVKQNAIILEEEESIFRERNSHNQLLDNFKNETIQLKYSLDESRRKNSELSVEIQEQRDLLDNKLQETTKNLTEHIIQINNQRNKSESEKAALINNVNDINRKNLLLEDELNIIRRQNAISEFNLSRLKNPKNKIIKVNNEQILEYFNSINQLRYYHIDNDMLVDVEVMMAKLKEFEFEESLDDFDVDIAEFQYEQYLNKS